VTRGRLLERSGTIPVAVSLIVVFLLLAGLAVIFQNEASYREQKLRQAEMQARILAASVTAALDFGDPTTAQESVNALRVNSEIVGAGVYDAKGVLFVAFERRQGVVPKSPRVTGSRYAPIEAIAPVVQSGEPIGTVYLGLVREPVSRRVTRYSVIGLLVLLAALAIGILGFAATALRRANRELGERAEALTDAYDKLQIEIGERAKAEEQLRQAQKMQALGQLTGGIAHDFNNLLTVIQGSADILRRPELAEEKRIRFAEAIVQTAGRAATLTGQLLAFARRQPLQPEVIDLNQRILAMIDLLDRTLGEEIEVRTELASELCAVEADPAQLESALLNIAVNARDAMPDGGALTVRTREVRTEDGNRAVALAVSDTGSGIDPEALARVFEPFFTTKSVGKGTGLGLSQVYGFATQSGGDATVESESGKGTTVTITLPCSTGSPAAQLEESGEPSAHRTGSILVVDDNEEVGAFAEVLLTELGHRVIRAQSAEHALEIIDGSPPDAVFTDVVMPGMSGLELAEELLRRWPGLPIVLTTGYSDKVTAMGTGGLPVLFKPYRLESLAGILDKVLAAVPPPTTEPANSIESG
jgi:signal transduction histidine kinase/ActR/RegA family two-component response regulator